VVGHRNEDGRLIRRLAEDIHLYTTYLSFVIRTTFNTHVPTAHRISKYLFRTKLFTREQQFLVVRGLQAYLDHDFIVAVHLLVPQLESALRQLIDLQGGTALKAHRRDEYAFQLLNFEELLRHDLIVSVLPKDLCLYLRVLIYRSSGLESPQYGLSRSRFGKPI